MNTFTAKPLGIGGHHSPFEGGTNDWLTPPSLLTALGSFDTDPCASVGQPWRSAARQFTIDDDGLEQQWTGTVWLNPPYGPNTGNWLARLAEHGNGIALVFARTETTWFHRHVWPRASGLYFFAGRLNFHRPVTGERTAKNSGAPSVLIAYGEAWSRLAALEGCRKYPGHFVRLHPTA